MHTKHEYCNLNKLQLHYEYLPNQITSSCDYCTQMAPACNKQVNVTTFCMDTQSMHNPLLDLVL